MKTIIVLIAMTTFLASCVQEGNVGVTGVSKNSGSGNSGAKRVDLDPIANQNTTEGQFLFINIDDQGDDFSSVNLPLTYSCFYDMIPDGTVAPSVPCSTLVQAFNVATGALSWTPSAVESGNYEFLISATDGVAADNVLFVVSVADGPTVSSGPLIDTIVNPFILENMFLVIDANDGGDDIDGSGDPISYTCYYDTVVDGVVANTTLCTGMGAVFTGSTGYFAWTPTFTQAGVYEVKITGSDGALSDDEIFFITVTDANRLPVLAAMTPETVTEGIAITTVNANDGGDDFDADGDPITYSCFYDNVADFIVNPVNACATLGVTLNPATGVLDWTPNFTQSGNYEFRIAGSDGIGQGYTYLHLTVNNVNQAPVLDTILPQTVSENAAIVTINANDGGDDLDIDLEPLAYSCFVDTVVDATVGGGTTCIAAGMSFNTTTGQLDWTPSYSDGDTGPTQHEIRINAFDGVFSDDKIFVITVNNTNRSPSLDPITDQNTNELVAFTTVDASDGGNDFDVDGDSITYACFYDTTIDGVVGATLTCVSKGMTFNTATGVLDWTPTYLDQGNYEIKISATDGSLSDNIIFLWGVTDVNRAPSLTAPAGDTVNEGVAITTQDVNDGGDDLDIDLQALTYTCYYDMTVDTIVNATNTCASIGMAFNSSTGQLDWTPNFAQDGTYEVKVIGSDGIDTDAVFFVITVNNVFAIPILDPISNETVNEGVALTTIDANDGGDELDGDGELISYSCEFDNVFSGTMVAPAACTTISGLSFNTITGVLNWTPSYSQSGTYEFHIVATDTSLDTDEAFVQITVININAPPVLDAIADQGVTELSAITTIDAADGGDDFDSDAQALTYTCTYDTTIDGIVPAGIGCAVLGISFNTGTGVMDWTPTGGQSGTYEFRIRGTDGTDNGDEVFVISVIAGVSGNPANQPVLSNIINSAINEGQTFVADADDGGDDLDADGDPIIYSCWYDNTVDGTVAELNTCGALANTTFNSSTGILVFSPDFSQAASYEFKIKGTDGTGFGQEIFFINVNNINQPPVLDAISNIVVNENVAITPIDAGDSTTGPANDMDVDGEVISYQCHYDIVIDASVVEIAMNNCANLANSTFNNTTGVFNWTPSLSQSGNYEFRIRASDPGTLSDYEQFIITVNDVNSPPVIDVIADQLGAMENTAITQINANDGGDDLDADGQVITYSCVFDNTNNGTVSPGTNCATISGLVFDGNFGTIDWTPNYNQAGIYEFKITGTDGSTSDTEIFVIDVANTNRSPALNTISNIVVTEQSAMSPFNPSDTTTGNDTDIDGDTITYSCYYDTTVDFTVGAVNDCVTNLTGGATSIGFNTSTGVMTWTPGITQAGVYEVGITANDGNGGIDQQIFTITVNNLNQAPNIDQATIPDQIVTELSPITTVNVNNITTGNDTDVDGDILTYSCEYDMAPNGAVSGPDCTTLPGFAYNVGTGVINWTPSLSQAGTYEFKITASDGSNTNSKFFQITVNNLLFTLSVNITGLTSTGGSVIVQNDDNGDSFPTSTDGVTAFATQLDINEAYTISFPSQPINYICTTDTPVGNMPGANLQIEVVCRYFFTTIAVGNKIFCATDVASNGFCWGDEAGNHVFILADGISGGAFANYIKPSDNQLPGTDWAGFNIPASPVNSNISAIDIYNSLLNVGEGSSYQIGDSVNADRYNFTYSAGAGASLLNIEELGMNNMQGCMLHTSGLIFCWGNDLNDYDYFYSGDSTDPMCETYIQYPGMNIGCMSNEWITRPPGVIGFTSLAVPAGLQDAACAVADTNEAYCWGNGSSIMGDGSSTPNPDLGLVDGVQGYTIVRAGFNHVCGVHTDGTVSCWGDSGFGKTGGAPDPTKPYPIPGLANISNVSLGVDHSCGIDFAGDVYCWGKNTSGQLGQSFSPQYTTPALLEKDFLPAGTNLVDVKVGNNTTCVLDSKGQMWCFGILASGNSYIPQKVDQSLP